MRIFIAIVICLLGKYVIAEELKEIDVIAYIAPPYITVDEDKINGITIRVIESAFKEAGLVPRFTIYPYGRALAACRDNPNCVHIGAFEGMGSHFDGIFHQINFINYSTTLFYNEKDHPEYASTTLKDNYSGKKIACLQSEFDNLKYFENQGAEIISLNSHIAVFQMLQSGRVDFAHFVRLIGNIEVSRNNASHIKDLKESIVVSSGGLVFRDEALANKVFQAFTKLNKNDQLVKIMQSELDQYPNLDLHRIVPKEITMESKNFDHANKL